MTKARDLSISGFSVGLAGFEPATSSMSRMRANQLCHNPLLMDVTNIGPRPPSGKRLKRFSPCLSRQ